MGWLKEHDALLIDCRRKGMSFSQSAREINEQYGTVYSRNSCISRAGRLGDAVRPAKKSAPKPTPRQPLLRTTTQFLKKKASTILVEMEWAAAPEIVPEMAAATGPARDVRELKDGDCHWPCGGDREGEPIVFCCSGTAVTNFSYCRRHLRMSIGSGTTSERAAHKVSRRVA